MKGVKGSTKKQLVAVYFDPQEVKQIRKRAGKEVLGISPFLRKIIVQTLEITVETN